MTAWHEICITVPIRIESEQNRRDHWAAKARRVKRHREAVGAALYGIKTKVELPCTVRLVRIAPRALDSHDNLRAGFKATVDEVAKRLGVDDSDPRVTWVYAQTKGKPREYAAYVQIEWAA